MNNVQSIYNNLMQEGSPLLKYEGAYSDELLEDILNKVENLNCVSNKIRRKMFFISVELLQNIHHHSLKKSFDGLPRGYFHFVLSKLSNKVYKISAANFVDRNKFNTLVSRIDQLNLLNALEVKQLYKTVLNNNEFSEKGGGGLGMIDIKRKSQQKLEYTNINFNENLYFFNFSIFLENKI